ncbi:MAG: gluconate 2-dehydrogenase subunit 3 family protein [Acidobacteria bacterium]|nr:gluconate 2-dehydrogenase subunit 3 family protein [Acidobacteriota bacterium]
MAGQEIERREMIRLIGIAAVAATFPGFHQWSFACSHEMAKEAAAVGSGSYKPLFFSAEQYKLIEHLAEMIIPTDDTPGAKEAGVAEFIDFMVANRVPVSHHAELSEDSLMSVGAEIQLEWIEGINWLNAHSGYRFDHAFLDCSSEQQVQILETLAYKSKFTPSTETGRDFFQTMKDYTVAGYYTTKVGLESLGYPGLRTAWPKMPGCSHPDDPTHAKLREAVAGNQSSCLQYR